MKDNPYEKLAESILSYSDILLSTTTPAKEWHEAWQQVFSKKLEERLKEYKLGKTAKMIRSELIEKMVRREFFG